MTEAQDLRARNLRIAAGIVSIAAGWVHGVAAPEHLAEWWGYGTFFLLSAMGQAVYGFVLFGQPWRYDPKGHVRPDADRFALLAYRLGIWLNGAVVLLYLITRTVGVPFFGPEAGEVEPLTPLSLVSKALEVGLILLLALLIQQTVRNNAGLNQKTSQ